MDKNKISKIFKFLVGTFLMFISLIFIASGLDSGLLALLAVIASPIIVYFFNKKIQLKSLHYYVGLFAIFIISFIFAGSMIEPMSSDSVASNNDSAIVEQQKSDSDKEDNKQDENKNEEKQQITNVEESETNNENEGNIQQVISTEAQIHFIDTGNSDSILIVQGDKSVLIDAGDNDDESLVSNYIKNQGVQKLSYVISTHPDADHCGGLDGVFNSIPVEKLFVSNSSSDSKTYTDFITSAANKGINGSVPLEGSEFKLTDNSYIKFFNTNGGSDTNEASLITLFVNGDDKLLFMGDAESETENEILSNMTDVDLVKIGHHGSKNATTQSFIDKISPEYAVILTGSNSYGHPTATILDRLKGKNIELHRTDECGDIVFTSTGSGISTSCSVASFTPGDSSSSSNTGGGISSSNNGSTQTTTQEQPTASQTTSEGKFIITMTGTKYHLPGCSTIKQVKSEVTREEAEAQGYEPCGRCHP